MRRRLGRLVARPRPALPIGEVRRCDLGVALPLDVAVVGERHGGERRVAALDGALPRWGWCASLRRGRPRTGRTEEAGRLGARGRGVAFRDQFDLVPEFSRRARGFPVYAALRWLGRRGVADLIERCCAHARRFAGGMTEVPGAHVLNDVVLNQVLVRVDDDQVTARLSRRVLAEGTASMTGITFRGTAAMRISLSNWTTTESDVDASLAALRRIATEGAESVAAIPEWSGWSADRSAMRMGSTSDTRTSVKRMCVSVGVQPGSRYLADRPHTPNPSGLRWKVDMRGHFERDVTSFDRRSQCRSGRCAHGGPCGWRPHGHACPCQQ